MTITVTNQDGSTIDFDDDTPQSTIALASKRYAVTHGTADTMGGDMWDTVFHHTPGGRILEAVGLGASAQWGEWRWGPSPKIEKELVDMGLFNDYQAGEHNLGKSVVEAVARPLSLAVQDVLRGPPAVIGGIQEGIRQAGREIGLPGVGEFVAATPEFLGGLAGVHLEIPPMIRQAVRYRVLGPDAEPNPNTLPVSPAEREFGEPGAQRRTLASQPIVKPEEGVQPELPGLETPPAGSVPPAQGELPLPGITIEAPADFTPPEEPVPPPRPAVQHVDENGNFKWDTINNAEDVDRAIKQRMGPSTDEEPPPALVEDLADAVGVTPEEIMGRDHGTTEEVNSKIKILTDSAEEIHDTAGAARDDPTNLESTLKFADALDRHMMIQATILGDERIPSLAEEIKPKEPAPGEAAAEAKPAGEAAKSAEPTPEQKAATEVAQSVGNGVAAMTNAKQVSTFLQKIAQFIKDDFAQLIIEGQGRGGFWGYVGRGLRDSVLEMWKSALMSGMGTHIPYAIGQLLLAITHSADVAAGAAVGQLARPINWVLGRPQQPRIPLAAAPTGLLYGLFQGTPEGIIMSWSALKTGYTALLPGETSAPFALGQTRTIPMLLGGGVIRLSYRGVAAIHSLSRGIMSEQIRAEAAVAEAEKTTTPMTPAFFSKIQEVTDNMPRSTMEAVNKEVNALSLMGEGGRILQMLSRATVQWPSLGFLTPFTKIVGNSFRQGILEHTPAGFFFDKGIHDNLMGRNGPAARDLQYGKLIVGAGIATVFIGYMAQGKATGSGPPDYREGSLETMIGGPPYSIQFGNVAYGYSRWGPLGQLLAAVAGGYEIAHAIKDPEKEHLGQLILASLSHMMIEDSFMQTPAEFIEAMMDHSGVKWEKFMRNQMSSMFPLSAGLRQAAANMDPYMREALTLGDALKRNIPWLRQSLYPEYDIFGEPIPSSTAGMLGIAGIHEYQLNNDPVLLAMKRLEVFPGKVSRYIRMGKTIIELTPQQHADYARISGRLIKARLDDVVAGPAFNNSTPYVQHKMIESTIENLRRGTERQIRHAYPNIIKQAVDIKEKEHMGMLPPRKAVKQEEEEE